MIPTETAVICKIFVCHLYNLFVYVWFDCIVHIRKLKYTNRVNFSVLTVLLAEMTHLYSHLPFSKKALADITILCLLESGITLLILNKDDIEFVTEFPCNSHVYWDTLYEKILVNTDDLILLATCSRCICRIASQDKLEIHSTPAIPRLVSWR